MNSKNILILSSLYPVPDFSTNTTPVVHYFAREWVKLGYNVIVIHNQNKFPLFFYYFPEKLKEIIESFFSVRIPRISQKNEDSYNIEGVSVYRLPIFKIFPFLRFSQNVIDRQVTKIIDACEKNDFTPNYILGHWEYPQLPLTVKLKKKYSNAITSLVFHSLNYTKKNISFRKDIKYLDFIGFRSKSIQTQFEKLNGKFPNSFLCFSGIPDEFLNNYSFNERKDLRIKSFTFVGLLIKRKFPEIILPAILKSEFHNSFIFNVVGEGIQKTFIEKISKLYSVENRVVFHNKISRENVFNLLLNTNIFIMVSKDEAFGLVYLEAMLAGCIVIASRDEGMDGIIENGFNGFLIEAGSELELIIILNKIFYLDINLLKSISYNAHNTARRFSDSFVAVDYLRKINILS